MEDIQMILGLISAFLGIILVILKIFEAWIKVADPVKDFLSKPVVWLVITALVLVGVYLIVGPVIGDHKDVKVAFKTAHNRHVSAMGADWDWAIRAETTEILDFELFTLLDADTELPRSCSEVVQSLKDDGETRIAFQTVHIKEGKNRLVTAMDGEWNWGLRGETNELRASERFTATLISSP